MDRATILGKVADIVAETLGTDVSDEAGVELDDLGHQYPTGVMCSSSCGSDRGGDGSG